MENKSAYDFPDEKNSTTTEGGSPNYQEIGGGQFYPQILRGNGPSKISIIIIVLLVAVLLCLSVLIVTLLNGKSEIPISPPIQKSTVLKKECGVDGAFGSDKGMDPNYSLFDECDRRDVEEIKFMDSVKNAPDDAWDVSDDGNGGVKAWLEEGTLYIVANGGVTANEDCAGLFAYCTNLKKIDFNDSFRTESVEDMQYFFYKCDSLREADFSGINTSSVTSMNRMFADCSRLNYVDVSDFDTSAVRDMYAMFRNCSALQSVDLSNWDTERVITMSRMFEGCNSLVSADVSDLDTKNVKNMSYMFYQCYALSQLDVSGFETENVTNMCAMFSNCMSLTAINVSHFDTSNVSDMSYMFTKCGKVVKLDVKNFDTRNVKTMQAIFRDCPGATGYEDWNTKNAKDKNKMFK